MLNEIYQALDPIAFWIGPFAVRWYGLGYIFGILLGGLAILQICKRWKVHFNFDSLLTLYITAVLGIVLGARFGYILFYGGTAYLEDPARILAFSEGGMSFHGGIIGMVIALLILCRILKMPFGTLADLVVIVAPIGIFLVRIANFINGELWGSPTDLPWGVEFETGGGIPRHPSQLYESALEGLVLFIIMMLLSRRKPTLPRFSFMGIFFIIYSVFRILIEFVREPDAHIGYLAGGWLTMGMVLSFIMLLFGVGILIYAHKMQLPQVGLPEYVEEDSEEDDTDEEQDDYDEDSEEESIDEAHDDAEEDVGEHKNSKEK